MGTLSLPCRLKYKFKAKTDEQPISQKILINDQSCSLRIGDGVQRKVNFDSKLLGTKSSQCCKLSLHATGQEISEVKIIDIFNCTIIFLGIFSLYVSQSSRILVYLFSKKNTSWLKMEEFIYQYIVEYFEVNITKKEEDGNLDTLVLAVIDKNKNLNLEFYEFSKLDNELISISSISKFPVDQLDSEKVSKICFFGETINPLGLLVGCQSGAIFLFKLNSSVIILQSVHNVGRNLCITGLAQTSLKFIDSSLTELYFCAVTYDGYFKVFSEESSEPLLVVSYHNKNLYNLLWDPIDYLLYFLDKQDKSSINVINFNSLFEDEVEESIKKTMKLGFEVEEMAICPFSNKIIAVSTEGGIYYMNLNVELLGIQGEYIQI